MTSTLGRTSRMPDWRSPPRQNQLPFHSRSDFIVDDRLLTTSHTSTSTAYLDDPCRLVTLSACETGCGKLCGIATECSGFANPVEALSSAPTISRIPLRAPDSSSE